MGIYALYKSQKTKAKILLYFGLTFFFLSQLYFATILDFLFLLATGDNIDNSNGLFSILTYIWIGPAIILGMYIIIEVTIPEKKWFILPFYIILSIIFEILLFLDPINSFNISYTTSNGGIIHSHLVMGSLLFIIICFIFILAFIFFGLGFFIIGIQTTGILKKKFMILSSAFVAFLTIGAIDILTAPGIYVIFLRIAEMSTAIIFYFGIREETVVSSERETKGSEYQIPKTSLISTLSYSRPEDLTEDDILYFREQTLCMVCKTLIIGFVDVFICPDCKALYCRKCAKELIKIDNMCWGCLGPIDDSKPIKYDKEEGKEDISIIDVSKNKEKNK